MNVERKDFWIGLAMQVFSILAIWVSFWLWFPFQVIGFQLSMGTIRGFYNKYFWRKVYWWKQKRLWKKSFEVEREEEKLRQTFSSEVNEVGGVKKNVPADRDCFPSPSFPAKE